mgnify:CR=1 FL=1
MPAAASPEITEIIAQNQGLEGPLLPILHDVQAAFGHIPDTARAPIADALNITEAELHGVISFYHDIRRKPAGRHVLKVCQSEACQAMGSAAMSDKLLKLLGLDAFGSTPDGRLTVEPVYCLGLCACGPAAMLDGRVIGRVSADSLAQEVAQ